MMDIHELMSKAKLPETTVPLCMRGDLLAEWERLERQLQREAEQDANRKLADPPAGVETAQRMEALEREMRDYTVDVRFRALGWRRWHEVGAEHSPREGKDADKRLGVNEESFFLAVVPESLVEPEFTDEQFEEFLDLLTSQQWNSLCAAVFELNRTAVDIPFSQTASRIMQTSGGTSKQQQSSGSPTSGSAGGSRKRSPGKTKG